MESDRHARLARLRAEIDRRHLRADRPMPSPSRSSGWIARPEQFERPPATPMTIGTRTAATRAGTRRGEDDDGDRRAAVAT